jgi:hypothetical protein
MPNYTELVLAIIICAVILYFVRLGSSEGYESKAHKADHIYKSWKSGVESYVDYKNKVPGSDIIEYTKVKGLHKTNQMTKGNIENVIS